MRIVVCVKHVSDTTELRFSGTGELLTRGVPTKISDYDRHAIELGARFREEQGATVTLVCLGPADAAKTLKEGLARGADDALLVADPAAGDADPAAVARILAAAAGRGGMPDLVLCGDVSEDGYNGLVPAMLAAHLGVPHAGSVGAVEWSGEALLVTSVADGWRERSEIRLPAVLSVSRTINQPRAVTALQVMKVPVSRIVTIAVADLGLARDDVLSVDRASTRLVAVRPAGTVRRNEVVTGDPGQAVDRALESLRAAGVVR
jgi:electron transfer flavoprotein beta subunit